MQPIEPNKAKAIVDGSGTTAIAAPKVTVEVPVPVAVIDQVAGMADEPTLAMPSPNMFKKLES